MPIEVMDLLGAKVDGFNVIEELEDELILTIRFIDDRGNKHDVSMASGDLKNSRRVYDEDEKKWKLED